MGCRFGARPSRATGSGSLGVWNKARRYVIKRTPIVDKDDQQLYLDDGLRQYVNTGSW